MSSHGKSIGRIQSAPPDEGEPDLKIQYNLNATEFNPQSFIKSSQAKKELSAAASDYVPEKIFVPTAPPPVFHQYYQSRPKLQKFPQAFNLYQVPVAVSPLKSFAFNPGVTEFAPADFVPKIDKIPEFDLGKILNNPEALTKGVEDIEKNGKSEENAEIETKIKELANGEGKDHVENTKLDENTEKLEAEVLGDRTKTGIESDNKDLNVSETDKVNEVTEAVNVSIEPVCNDPDIQDLILSEDLKTSTKDSVYKKKVYDIEAIKNFKFTFVKDPNFLILPQAIIKIKDREVEETKAAKGNRRVQEDRRLSKEFVRKVVVWRKAKTAEEQKISDRAKAYQRKFTATVAEQEKIKKEVKSTLNKLSPNNLAKLTSSILETCKKSHDYLKLVVSGIFEKAWSEKKYTQMYSDMCKNLKNSFEGFRYPDVDPSKLPETRNYFKYELLYMCEETFVKNHSEEDFSNLTVEQKTERFAKLKDKTLGNVRFIGELFNVNLITPKIILECVTGLLDLFEREQNQDRLEGACLLLLTGGPSFERSKLLPETNRIYDLLEQISATGISSKNKFKIMDLKEARLAGWNSLQRGLKKVEEIHADHMIEQEEIKRRHGYNN